MKFLKFAFIIFLFCGCNTENIRNETEEVEHLSEQEMQMRLIHFSEDCVKQYLSRYGNVDEVTVDGSIPIKNISYNVFLVNGIIMAANGTGLYTNYSCHISCTNPGNVAMTMTCKSLFINGEKVK